MSIQDLSNMPDHMVPEWVRRKREQSREAPKRRAFHKKDGERIRREIDAIKEASR